MTPMKRWIFALLFVFTIGASIQAEVFPVRFWAALPEPDHALMAQIIEQYNLKHAETPIDYRNFDSKQLLLEALQRQDAPDLALVDSQWVARLKDKLVPAEDILNHAGSMVRAIAKADTFKPIWNTGVIDDKAYAIPFSAETAGLVISSQHFAKPPKISNIEQLTKIAVQIKKGPVVVTPLILPLKWDKDDLAKLWLGFVQSVAKPPLKFWTRPNPSTLPFTLYDETAALTLWWNWVYRSKIASAEEPALPTHFIDGATWILTPRDVSTLNEPFKVLPLPKDKRAWGYLHVDSLVFFGSEKGWDFANFLTDYPMIKLWSMHTPTVPVNKQVYLSPDYLQDIDAHRPWMRVYIGAIMQGPSWMDAGNDELQLIGDTLSKNLHNEMSIQEGVLKIHSVLTK